MRVAELVDRLDETFAGVGRESVEALLRHLVAEHFLITSLRVPMTDTDPLGYLAIILQRADACELAEVAPLNARRGIRAWLSGRVSGLGAADMGVS